MKTSLLSTLVLLFTVGHAFSNVTPPTIQETPAGTRAIEINISVDFHSSSVKKNEEDESLAIITPQQVYGIRVDLTVRKKDPGDPTKYIILETETIYINDPADEDIIQGRAGYLVPKNDDVEVLIEFVDGQGEKSLIEVFKADDPFHSHFVTLDYHID